MARKKFTTRKLNAFNYEVRHAGDLVGHICFYSSVDGWLFTAASRELAHLYPDTCTPVHCWRRAIPVVAA